MRLILCFLLTSCAMPVYRNGHEWAAVPVLGAKAHAKITKPDGTIIDLAADGEKVGGKAVDAYKVLGVSSEVADMATPVVKSAGKALEAVVK